MRTLFFILASLLTFNAGATQQYFVNGVTKTYNIAEVMHFMGESHSFHMEATMIGENYMPGLDVVFSTSPKLPEVPEYISMGELPYEYLQQFSILVCSGDEAHDPIMLPDQCKTLEVPWSFLAVHSFDSVSYSKSQRRIIVKGKRYITEGFKEIKTKQPDRYMEIRKFELIIQFQPRDSMTKISAVATLKD